MLNSIALQKRIPFHFLIQATSRWDKVLNVLTLPSTLDIQQFHGKLSQTMSLLSKYREKMSMDLQLKPNCFHGVTTYHTKMSFLAQMNPLFQLKKYIN